LQAGCLHHNGLVEGGTSEKQGHETKDKVVIPAQAGIQDICGAGILPASNPEGIAWE